MPNGQMRLMRTKSKPLSNQTETVREVANKLKVSHTAIENYLKWLGLVKILDIWVQHEIHLKRVSTWDLLLKCKKIFILKTHCHWKWKVGSLQQCQPKEIMVQVRIKSSCSSIFLGRTRHSLHMPSKSSLNDGRRQLSKMTPTLYVYSN